MILTMPQRLTYSAELFETKFFKVAGTLDGYIDIATKDGTYPVSIEEAAALSKALNACIGDISLNCLWDNDTLLRSK